MKRSSFWCVLAAAAAILFAGTADPSRSATGLCGTANPSTAHYTHVIWILEENHSYGRIIGNSHARYINGLAHEWQTDELLAFDAIYNSVGLTNLNVEMGYDGSAEQDGQHNGEATSFYVRPHELEIDRTPENRGLAARVLHISPAGPLVRVQLVAIELGMPVLVTEPGTIRCRCGRPVPTMAAGRC